MQPNNGVQWYNLATTSAGTPTIKAEPCILVGVMIGNNKTGTVTFHDSASGTTAKFMSGISNAAGTAPVYVQMNAQMKAGLTAVVGGTVDVTVFYI